MTEPSFNVDISFVIPVFNEEEALPHLFDALDNLCDSLRPRYSLEIILIDDGSTDGTWDTICKAATHNPIIRGIALARNFGHQAALTCGYHMARGRAVISLDADLQDPPEVALRMIDEWERGADVVFAVRKQRPGETSLKLLTARWFYWLFEHLSGTRVPRNAGDFRLLSRRALNALNALPERHRYIRGLVGWIGFRTTTIYYDRRERIAGTTKYPFRKMLRLAVDAIVSMSFTPLRAAYLVAFIGALPFLLYLAVTTFRWLFFHHQLVPGWASLILAIIVFGSMNLLCIGIMGEYVGRIYEEVKHRPLYVLRETVPSAAPPASNPNDCSPYLLH